MFFHLRTTERTIGISESSAILIRLTKKHNLFHQAVFGH
jgi:hypothetical protein